MCVAERNNGVELVTVGEGAVRTGQAPRRGVKGRVVEGGGVVGFLTLTRIMESVVTGQTPVTLE